MAGARKKSKTQITVTVTVDLLAAINRQLPPSKKSDRSAWINEAIQFRLDNPELFR